MPEAGKLRTESAGTVTYFTLKFISYAGNWDFSIIDPVSTPGRDVLHTGLKPEILGRKVPGQ